jgi:GT2 family glycosyltransferase
MAVRGFVDEMQGGYILGWAVAISDGASCVITVKDGEGRLLGKGLASRERADLASLGLGRTNFGFRVAVPHAHQQRIVHVFANDQELQGSPLRMGAGMFDGACRVEADHLTGWVTERVARFAAPVISAKNQFGEEVARGESHFDDGDIDPLFAPARFSLRLDDRCLGAGEMPLTVYVNDTVLGRVNCHLTLKGNLDQVSPTRCAGWLLCEQAPQRRISFTVHRDQTLMADVTCDSPRPDVSAIYPGADTPGFDVTFPGEAPQPTTACRLSFRLPGCAHEIFEGPYLLAERPAAVEALQRAAQLAHLPGTGLGEAERALLAQALAEYVDKARGESLLVLPKQPPAPDTRRAGMRLGIVIPVYRGVEITRACIEAVLRHRNPDTDLVILLNDASPEPGMAVMLAYFGLQPNVVVLTNAENQGFIRTVNRGLSLVDGLDVLLLNSDTVIHAGGLDELTAILAQNPEIGTVTAISNNATIFSYPNTALRAAALSDISWPELAAIALRDNRGRFIDVPTGHGFCLLIRADVIARVGRLDEAFGRGYGEENDFCARAAVWGYRNVAAGAVLVEHKERVSFVDERETLMAENMRRLHTLYPDYMALIQAFERQDGTRSLRWALDAARLTKARQAGGSFVLVVTNQLEGGTAKTILDIERNVGYGQASALRLSVTRDHLLELSCETPLLSASFGADEIDELFTLLSAAAPEMVMLHQLLGFPAAFIAALPAWLTGRESFFWAHDFYAVCPRVTMIDAIGRFCDVADEATCERCLGMKGGHEFAAAGMPAPAEHRALFGALLRGVTHVIAPSPSAAAYLGRVFEDVPFEILPHPEALPDQAVAPRADNEPEIIMIGAIGPHKGSTKLLEIAERAWLTRPELKFRVIGYTDIDKKLQAVGNVTITGSFPPGEGARLLGEARGRLVLFLSTWPETYSYTLSEVLLAGMVPLVPDIGAPAERVRRAGVGAVFPFPADAETVLGLIDEVLAGARPVQTEGADALAAFRGAAELTRYRDLLCRPVE